MDITYLPIYPPTCTYIPGDAQKLSSQPKLKLVSKTTARPQVTMKRWLQDKHLPLLDILQFQLNARPKQNKIKVNKSILKVVLQLGLKMNYIWNPSLWLHKGVIGRGTGGGVLFSHWVRTMGQAISHWRYTFSTRNSCPQVFPLLSTTYHTGLSP